MSKSIRHNPMYLTIEDPVTLKKFPGKPIDIVNTLMQAKDVRGNYIYNNQADFDREYEHPIEIKIDTDSECDCICQRMGNYPGDS